MESSLDTFSFPSPPTWSLNLGSAGKFLVIAAAVLYLLAAISGILASKDSRVSRLSTWLFQGANAAVISTFVILATLFAFNRFEYQYVWGHSDTRNALQYRIAGVWSGQQGSFLLWATCTAHFGLVTLHLTRGYRRWVIMVSSVFMGSIAAILAFESPFNLNVMEGKAFVPPDGFGLAPSLQNYWVVIHPPVIFLGFGSLTILFALAVTALITKDYENWTPIVRPLSIVSLTLVGLGLCMGGFWAYETLGWGGFWMWDPVENVSFVPWCFVIALTHGVIVQVTKQKWQFSNLLLAGLPFLLFLYGTFLTRSGLLSDASVHSFAEMDRSALVVLKCVMGVSFLGFFALWFGRLMQARSAQFVPSSRLTKDRWMSVGIWFLSFMGLATLVGMSVPLVMALRGQKPSVVQEGLYHQVLPYIFIPLMLLMAITPYLSWRKTDPKRVASKMYAVACLSIGTSALLVCLAIFTKYNQSINLAPQMTLLGKFQVNGLAWMMFLIALCVFVIFANIWSAADLWKRSKMGVAGFLAHLGVATLLTGLIVSRGFELKAESMMMRDHPVPIMGYELQYRGMTSNDKDRENKLNIDVMGKDKQVLFTAYPGMYRTTMGDGQESVMVWPFIRRSWIQDTYISLGQPQTTGTQEVTLKPGKIVTFGDLNLKYERLNVNGEFGKTGTTFGAIVTVTARGSTKTVEPQLRLEGQQGMKSFPAPLDEKMNLVLANMNAADKSVTLRIDFTDPIFPIEVFHKPFTGLVFLGTLIMTVAGVMGAWYRRPPKFSFEPDVHHREQTEQSREERKLVSQGNSK